MDKLLALKDLAKTYPIKAGLFGTAGEVRAVNGVDLDVHRNETLGLVGESGCGKSTLARLILLLEQPDAGSITFDGIDALHARGEDLKKIRRGMQVVFQDPFGSLNPRKKVRAIIEEPMRIHHIGNAIDVRERAINLMDMVGLSRDMLERYPHEFSGGQRQRICIARALAIGPQLLICDEPVSSLDVSIQAQVINLLTDLQARFELSSLFISHDLSVVGYISQRVAVMYMGHIVELAPTDVIFTTPLHPYTRLLLDAIPSIRHRGRKHVQKEAVASPSGCPFHMRCPQAADRCVQERPRLVEQEEGHAVACFFV